MVLADIADANTEEAGLQLNASKDAWLDAERRPPLRWKDGSSALMCDCKHLCEGGAEDLPSSGNTDASLFVDASTVYGDVVHMFFLKNKCAC